MYDFSTIHVTQVRFSAEAGIFYSPPRPDRLWGPTQLPTEWVPRILPRGYSGRAMKLSYRLYLVPKLRMSGDTRMYPKVSGLSR
jgi:hypothetical protein